MSELRFTVPGAPFAWKRARHRGRQHYTPPEMRAYQDDVRLRARVALAGRAPVDGAVTLEVRSFVAMPARLSQRKRAAAEAGELRPVTRPDLDNYAKAVADALNGIAYGDDSQVVELRAHKLYGAEPRTEVVVRPAREAHP